MRNQKKGAVIVYVILTFAILAILVGAAFTLVSASINFAISGKDSRQAYLNAKSGIEYAKSVLGVVVDGYDPNVHPSPPAFINFYVYGSIESGLQYSDISIADPGTEIFATCEIIAQDNDGCSFKITSNGKVGNSIRTIEYGDDVADHLDGYIAFPKPDAAEGVPIPPELGSEDTERVGEKNWNFFDYDTGKFIWDGSRPTEGLSWYEAKFYWAQLSYFNELGTSNSREEISEKALFYSTFPISRKPNNNTSFTAGEMYFKNLIASYRNIYGNTDLRLCSNFFYFNNDIINNNDDSNLYLYTKKCTVDGQNVTLPNELNNQPGVIYLTYKWHKDNILIDFGSDNFGTDWVDIIHNNNVIFSYIEEDENIKGSYYLFKNGINLSTLEEIDGEPPIWKVTEEEAHTALANLGLDYREIEGTIASIEGTYR